MKRLSVLFALLASPALAASGPFFSLQNTNFVVLLAFILLQKGLMKLSQARMAAPA